MVRNDNISYPSFKINHFSFNYLYSIFVFIQIFSVSPFLIFSFLILSSVLLSVATVISLYHVLWTCCSRLGTSHPDNRMHLTHLYYYQKQVKILYFILIIRFIVLRSVYRLLSMTGTNGEEGRWF